MGTVYPRVYGGTPKKGARHGREKGLSPRVRGNPKTNGRQGAGGRSIPACTGEPLAAPVASGHRGVYPRVYGGTGNLSWNATQGDGLSPRVRGNPQMDRDLHGHQRSIPACTGEPKSRRSIQTYRKVYPRVYGGTPKSKLTSGTRGGLSPRVRGNRVDCLSSGRRVRSIPACTGEPVITVPDDLPTGVYPRVYGGTRTRRASRLYRRGLSPRVRGNPYSSHGVLLMTRSIPACTGEPSRQRHRQSQAWVYPRVYGGTVCKWCGKMTQRGLSPRVRGNHNGIGRN